MSANSKFCPPLVTLTTDFGVAAPYVAAMKGVILSINPKAQIIDLTHAIGPQNVRHAALFLKHSIPFFPPATLHVVVVDPGVGTERALLYVECDRQKLLVPDNGCWTWLGPPSVVRRLEVERFWRSNVSSTFHGRDILAPMAAHVSLGVDPAEVGPVADAWVELPFPAPHREAERLVGEVLFIDSFGNLITNIPREWIQLAPRRVNVGAQDVTEFVRTYAERADQTPVALISSFELLEIAVACGNASRLFNVDVGAPVIVEF